MTTGMILVTAILVFSLMVVGLMLTAAEFNRISDEPSRRKGVSIELDPVPNVHELQPARVPQTVRARRR